MNKDMDNRVALLFTHKGNSEYLWYCLEQAKKSCPNCRIILLGDEQNKSDEFQFEHYLISDYFESASQFEHIYRHQSSNQYWYELFCFQRWFIIKDFVQKNNVLQFFCCDTDILIYDDLTKWIPKINSKFTIANRNGPQCSYFTKDSINDFCSYITKQYTNQECVNRLLKRYRNFLDNKLPGGNCDMTMFEFYEMDYPESVHDFGFEKIDSNKNLIYCCSATYEWMEDEFKNKLHFAKILINNNLAYIIAKDGNKLFCPVIHFQGPYKEFMYNYATIDLDIKNNIKQKYAIQKSHFTLKSFIKLFIPYGILSLFRYIKESIH